METKTQQQQSIDEISELKNIKYKTSFLNSISMIEKKPSNSNLESLEKFLENNKTNSQNENWSKLDKTTRMKKMTVFADKFIKEKEYNEEESKLLIAFLIDCLDRKKLQKVKDVVYDKLSGEIKEIPSLVFNKLNNRFTLKITDKRINTLKSLPTKKTNTSTIKNKLDEKEEDEYCS